MSKQLEAEIERLKAGKFTPEEFQNLCHNTSLQDILAFRDGCDAYQRKMLGSCRTDELKAELAQWQRFAHYCRSCALSGEHNPMDFTTFIQTSNI